MCLGLGLLGVIYLELSSLPGLDLFPLEVREVFCPFLSLFFSGLLLVPYVRVLRTLFDFIYSAVEALY